MGIIVSHNVAALNAWKNLSVSNSSLGKSLEKLSSGYQINRGADNPAGLVISEKLRAQATGLEQAVKNTEDAVSVIQVAEGALSEVHSILNSIRALAVHSANSGANDSASIAADQSQVDNAIDAISRIANTTKFLGKYLLNGGAGSTATNNTPTSVSGITLSTVESSMFLAYNITSVAARATYSVNYAAGAATNNSLTCANSTMTLNGISIALSASLGSSDVVNAINAQSSNTGVYALDDSASHQFVLYSTGYGSDKTIVLNTQSGILSDGTTIGDGSVSGQGDDVTGTIDGATASGNGLSLVSTDASWSGTSITFTAAGNTSGGQDNNVSVAKNQLQFNIGGNATANELINFSINDMRATSLGNSTNGYLDNSTLGIKTGQGYALATNAAAAVVVIDDAITSVSNERSKLGAYQKNAIESMQNNLSATLENIQASESRIRDLDIAKEMMNFTKNQILIQAGTSMLAQANQIPQAALKLLG